MRRLLSLLYLFCFFTTIIYAFNVEWKNGFIVTNDNNTIRGEIGLQDEGKDHLICLFRENAAASQIKYMPADIDRFGTDDGLIFVSLHLKTATIDETYFARFLFEGIVNLYYIELPDGSIDSYIFKKRGDDKFRMVKAASNSSLVEKKRMRSHISVILNDSQEIQGDINKLSGNRDDLIKLLEKYHDLVCNEERCIIHVESKPSRSSFLTPYIGLRDVRMTNEVFRSIIDQDIFSPMIGVEYSTAVERFSSKWMFTAALDVTNLRVEKTIKGGNQYKFSGLIIGNDLGIEYRILSLKVIPSFMLGFFHRYMIETKNETTSGKDLDYQKYGGGFFLNAGVDFPLKNGHSIPVKVAYHRIIFGNALAEGRCVSAYEYWTISMGYKFRL